MIKKNIELHIWLAQVKLRSIRLAGISSRETENPRRKPKVLSLCRVSIDKRDSWSNKMALPTANLVFAQENGWPYWSLVILIDREGLSIAQESISMWQLLRMVGGDKRSRLIHICTVRQSDNVGCDEVTTSKMHS